MKELFLRLPQWVFASLASLFHLVGEFFFKKSGRFSGKNDPPLPPSPPPGPSSGPTEKQQEAKEQRDKDLSALLEAEVKTEKDLAGDVDAANEYLKKVGKELKGI